MKFNVRNLTENDYETLVEWWDWWPGWVAPPKTVLPETGGHFANNFFYNDIEITKFGYKKLEEEEYKFKDFLKFNENEIISIKNYTGKDGKKRRSYFELDRVTGILIDTFGIKINESGEEYVEHDGNTYIRGDLYFDYHVYSNKFICENHKGI